MKNSQKGSTTAVVLIIVIVLLIIAFGVYVYFQNSPSFRQISSQQEATTTQSTTTQTSIQNVPISQTTSQTSSWQTYTDSALGISFKYPANWVVTPTIKSDTNYNGDLLTPPDAQGSYSGIYISQTDCQTVSQQHRGKILACQEVGTVAVYYGLTTNPEILNAFDAVASSVVIFVTTTAGQTAGWQTYTNTQFGFSFQYPVSYQLEKPDSNIMTIPNQENVAELYGSPDDILVTYTSTSTLDQSTAKYGPDEIYFDETTNQWIRYAPNNITDSMKTVITPSYTTNGLPYFADDTGISTSDIIPLSHDSFVIINIADNSPDDSTVLNNIAPTFRLTQ
jgi:hypothetical protein